jgi:mersacidin/lichenicidin family type 2 lantibiotic
MTPTDIIRAWRDEEYRGSLSDEMKASLPDSPVGFPEVSNNYGSSAVAAATFATWCDDCYTQNPCTAHTYCYTVGEPCCI